jgi:hypothetical protein
MIEMRHRGRLEATMRSWSHLEVGPGWPAPLVSLRASASFPCLLMSSRTFPSIFVEFWLDLVRFLNSCSFLAYSVFIPKNSRFTKIEEIVMLVPKTLAWWWFWNLLESSESYPLGTFSPELQIWQMIYPFRSSRRALRNGVLCFITWGNFMW